MVIIKRNPENQIMVKLSKHRLHLTPKSSRNITIHMIPPDVSRLGSHKTTSPNISEKHISMLQFRWYMYNLSQFRMHVSIIKGSVFGGDLLLNRNSYE